MKPNFAALKIKFCSRKNTAFVASVQFRQYIYIYISCKKNYNYSIYNFVVFKKKAVRMERRARLRITNTDSSADSQDLKTKLSFLLSSVERNA